MHGGSSHWHRQICGSIWLWWVIEAVHGDTQELIYDTCLEVSTSKSKYWWQLQSLEQRDDTEIIQW